ncbi:MAG: oligoribonuclease [actinobacterium acAMD-5]|jgi:oligoribonuclease|nr:MAG: oligoribonuclease [actinobacterium acAMD-5]
MNNQSRTSERIVWIDCEMTGLDLTKDALVEVACIVTEADLTELDAGFEVVIRPADMSSVENMIEVVKNMHAASGLIDEIPDGISLGQAEDQLLAYIKKHIPEPRKSPLAGSSVYVDRGFLSRDMPKVDAHMHYRLLDVSSVKEIVRRWYPRVFFGTPDKVGNHRALSDIRESIQELKFYRDLVFQPDPGPTTERVKAVADQINTARGAQNDLG